jgi:hypothetical protein
MHKPNYDKVFEELKKIYAEPETSEEDKEDAKVAAYAVDRISGRNRCRRISPLE